jgi:5-methylthioadenosine/S-adenosylhomocysteine deaminase
MTDSGTFPEQFVHSELLLVPEQVLLPEGPAADHAIVVADGRFSVVGPRQEVIAAHRGIDPVMLPGKMIMPGFVDVHHHLTQSFGKALAFGEPSEIFNRIWVPLEGVLDSELVYLAAKAAALEALRGGFTTVVDAGTRAAGGTAAIARAVHEAGLRCVLGYICNDLGDREMPSDRAAILRQAREHLDRWRDDNLVHPALAISIPEAASDEMLRDVSILAAGAEAIFQTHVNEHLAAVERSLVKRGQRPLEHLFHVGALGPHALIAHSTLVSPSELIMLKETDTAVAYCPVASQWKGNAVAPALMMNKLGIRFGLGTDGTRSDAFRLVDAAEACQRIAFGIAAGDFSSGAGWTWLDHATAGGAGAAGVGRFTGSLKAGFAADFLIVDIDVPELTPSWDLTWELVRLANRDQIIAVFVDGKLRLWRGWPPDWDGRALLREVRGRAAAAVAKAPIHRVHPVSNARRS